TRSEGTYYSVFWWFIKMGSALAGIVMGGLIVVTAFDEQQTVKVDALVGDIAVMKADADKWLTEGLNPGVQLPQFKQQLEKATQHLADLRKRFTERIEKHPDQSEHLSQLVERSDSLRSTISAMQDNSEKLAATPADLARQSEVLLAQTTLLK